MQALRDAAILLALGVLLLSVRVTPLARIDFLPSTEAASPQVTVPAGGTAPAGDLDFPTMAAPDGPPVFRCDAPADGSGPGSRELSTERCLIDVAGKTFCILEFAAPSPDGSASPAPTESVRLIVRGGEST